MLDFQQLRVAPLPAPLPLAPNQVAAPRTARKFDEAPCRRHGADRASQRATAPERSGRNFLQAGKTPACRTHPASKSEEEEKRPALPGYRWPNEEHRPHRPRTSTPIVRQTAKFSQAKLDAP